MVTKSIIWSFRSVVQVPEQAVWLPDGCWLDPSALLGKSVKRTLEQSTVVLAGGSLAWLCPNIRPRLTLLSCWMNQSLALKEGVFTRFPPQEAGQHVHSVNRAAGLQDGLPVRSSNLKNNQCWQTSSNLLHVYGRGALGKVRGFLIEDFGTKINKSKSPLAPSLWFQWEVL